MDNEEKRKKKDKKVAASTTDISRNEDTLSQNSYPSKKEFNDNPRRLYPKGFDQRSFISVDNHSNFSDDDHYQDEALSQHDDNVSSYGSEVYAPSHNMFKEMEAKKILNEGEALEEDPEEPRKTTAARKKWVFLTWFLTWWIPPCFLSWCGGMKRKDIQM